MPIAWWGLVGLFIAVLINRTADCWLSPARLQCGLTRHPWRQSAVLVVAPVMFMLVARQKPTPMDVAMTCLFAAVLLLVAIIDWEQRRVPNVMLLPALVVALVYAALSGDLLPAVLGATLAGAIFLVLYALGRRLYGAEALGMGDVKLAGLIGAIAGLPLMFYALALGILLAGVAAAGLLLTRRARRGDTLPYGAFMALAAVGLLILNPALSA